MNRSTFLKTLLAAPAALLALTHATKAAEPDLTVTTYPLDSKVRRYRVYVGIEHDYTGNLYSPERGGQITLLYWDGPRLRGDLFRIYRRPEYAPLVTSYICEDCGRFAGLNSYPMTPICDLRLDILGYGDMIGVACFMDPDLLVAPFAAVRWSAKGPIAVARWAEGEVCS